MNKIPAIIAAIAGAGALSLRRIEREITSYTKATQLSLADRIRAAKSFEELNALELEAQMIHPSTQTRFKWMRLIAEQQRKLGTPPA